MISTDGSVPRSNKYKLRVHLSGISSIIHEIGRLIEEKLNVKIYFHKRKSTSRSKDFKDKMGNQVYRYEIILYDLNLIKEIFELPFAYPSKKLRVMNSIDYINIKTVR